MISSATLWCQLGSTTNVIITTTRANPEFIVGPRPHHYGSMITVNRLVSDDLCDHVG
jgi:hypothetical protein